MNSHWHQRLEFGRFVVLAATLLACRFGLPVPPPTPGNCAQTTLPSDQDVDYALNYTGNILASQDWERTYAVESYRVNIQWLNNAHGGLAYLEYLLFGCGYSQSDLDEYFSEQNFMEVIFRDYESPQRVSQCSVRSLILHEFTASSHDLLYHIRYWVSLESETRILTLLLAIPDDSFSSLDLYANDLFPDLSSCQEQ